MNALTQHQLYELAHAIDRLPPFTPLVPPEVNLNGTSIDELLDQQMQVIKDLDALMEAMAQASPHGRDYQTSGGDKLYAIARAAWLHRRLLLETLRKEIEAYAMAIADQRRFTTRYVQPASVLVTGVPLTMEEGGLSPDERRDVAVALDEQELQQLLDDELKQVEPTDAA